MNIKEHFSIVDFLLLHLEGDDDAIGI